MAEPHKIWIEQCEAAEGIEGEFGTQKALEYLVGEKFLNFLEAAETDADFRSEIPAFVERIMTIFERWQLSQYLETAKETEPFDPALFEPQPSRLLGEEESEFDAEEVEDMRKDDIRQCSDQGGGICVGLPVAAATVRVIAISDEAIERWSEVTELEPGPIGEITVASPTVTDCYYNRQDATRLAKIRDGDTVVHRMGDLGYFDADGYLFLTGRSAELIISGGINIYPAEVDEALLRHPAVSDVATIGVPNPEWGEEVKAVILPADGFEPGDALVGELLEHCRQHLAGFKCPRSIDFTNALPRLPTGKIVRRKVRDRYTNDAPTE